VDVLACEHVDPARDELVDVLVQCVRCSKAGRFVVEKMIRPDGAIRKVSAQVSMV